MKFYACILFFVILVVPRTEAFGVHNNPASKDSMPPVTLGIPEGQTEDQLKGKEDPLIELHSGLLIDVNPVYFRSFQNVVGFDNLELLDQSIVNFGLEGGFTINRWQVSMQLGFMKQYNTDLDSLHLSVGTIFSAFELGYKIIDGRRIYVIPKLGVRWHRYRLLNSNKEYAIDIDRHLEDRDLDLRFNQGLGSLGLRVGYKIYDSYNANKYFTNYSVGFYAAHSFKLHDRPGVYSRRNELRTEGKLHYDQYIVGIYFNSHLSYPGR